jgi:hypothetical protein
MAETTAAPPPQPDDLTQLSPLLTTGIPTDGMYRWEQFTDPEHAARHLQASFTTELAGPPDEAATLFLTVDDQPMIAFVLPPHQGGPAVAVEPVDSDQQLRLLPDDINRDHRGVLRQIRELASAPAGRSASTGHDAAYTSLINDIRAMGAAARERMRADADAYLARTGSGDRASAAPSALADREGSEPRTVIAEPSEDLTTQFAELLSRAEAVGGRPAPWQPAAPSPRAQTPPPHQPSRGLGSGADVPVIDDVEALQGAFSGLARTNDPQISQDPRWKQLHKLWATMQDAAGRVRQGALRFRADAQAHGWRALWLRGCEALSATSHQMMQRLERTRGKDSVAWNAMRLLHHQAEVSIAHVRGDLPAGERKPIGTYDNVTTIATPPQRPRETAAPAGPSRSAAAPAHPGPNTAAARGVPGPLSWRMQAGGPVPQTAPAPPLPQRGPARDRNGTGR